MEKLRNYSELMSRFQQVADQIGAEMAPINSFSSPVGDYSLYKLSFRCGEGRQRICISAGMHGDEPASVEALLVMLTELHANRDKINADFTIFPCDNPTGYELNTRENYDGVDLNREFAKEQGQALEIQIIEEELRKYTFDFTMDVHEDIDTEGMYLYERARKGRQGLADDMINALKANGYPIHEADWIEGLPASGGIIWPTGRLRRHDLPKAVFLWHRGVQQLVTTESPGKLDLETRVKMQLVCFGVVLDAIIAERFAPAPHNENP